MRTLDKVAASVYRSDTPHWSSTIDTYRLVDRTWRREHNTSLGPWLVRQSQTRSLREIAELMSAMTDGDVAPSHQTVAAWIERSRESTLETEAVAS